MKIRKEMENMQMLHLCLRVCDANNHERVSGHQLPGKPPTLQVQRHTSLVYLKPTHRTHIRLEVEIAVVIFIGFFIGERGYI